MFGKEKCPKCKTSVKEKYSFCPTCGRDLRNPKKDERDFGLLGKNNVEQFPLVGGGGFGISDKIIEKILNSFMRNMPDVMKNLEKQMEQAGSEVEEIPNGIRISFGVPGKHAARKKAVRKKITEDQIKKMTGKPRVEAKTNVRRFSDKIVYELNALGIEDIDDVFVSKLENGYEVKAIGKKKVYVNSLPINLPLKGYRLDDNGLSVEFGLR